MYLTRNEIVTKEKLIMNISGGCTALGYSKYYYKGTCQNSFTLTTNLSHKFMVPSEGICYTVDGLSRIFTKLIGACAYRLHSNQIPQQMAQIAFFLNLMHTFHKPSTNVIQQVFCLPSVRKFDISYSLMGCDVMVKVLCTFIIEFRCISRNSDHGGYCLIL